MTDYYFVGTLLPDLKIGEIPELSFKPLDRLLRDNLKPADYARALQIRWYYSIENMRALWRGEPLDAYGFGEHVLEETLLSVESQPKYLRDFLEQYSSTEARLRFFPALLAGYFREEAGRALGFVAEYLQFERQLRLMQTAFRAKSLHRDLAVELQFEDPEEDFLQQLLAQKDNKKFVAPSGFERLQTILEEHYQAPIKLYKALCDYRFEKVEEFVEDGVFSVDRILAYMVQLIIVERWLELDREEGSKLVDQYIKEPA